METKAIGLTRESVACEGICSKESCANAKRKEINDLGLKICRRCLDWKKLLQEYRGSFGEGAFKYLMLMDIYEYNTINSRIAGILQSKS